jgi:hypothetical protein
MDEMRPDADYVPFRYRPPVVEERVRIPRRAGTTSSLLMAVLPLVALFVDIFFFAVSGEETTWTNLGIVTLATLVASYGLAGRDQRRLTELGLVVTTSPLIALICPIVYLFVRGSRAWRETATGLTAAWLNVLVILVAFGVVYELPVLIAALNGLTAATATVP